MVSKMLILVDGTAMLYRGFYAIPPLSTRSGVPTNAVLGFVRMLRQLETTWNPEHWAVVFDGGLPEERLTLQADYKAQRKPMPDELRTQIPLVKEYLDRSGVTWVRSEKQEADDVIASMTARGIPVTGQVLVATSDKDMFQLVTDKVRIVPLAGKNAVERAMGPEEVKTKTGVRPSQIVEWLALTGDASDNIPGVPGIGEKTAARLLDEHGTLEHIWADPGRISNERVRRLLIEHKELIQKNIRMVSLRKDLECSMDWEGMRCRPPNASEVLPFLEKYELHGLGRSMKQQDLFGE